MAAPIIQATGTLAAVTSGNLAITLPTYAADDIVVITTVGYIPNTTVGANTQSLASPWTKYSPDVTTLTGGLIDTEHAFWWARATSNSSLGTTVTITRPANWDTGTDTVWAGRAVVIRDAYTVGNPFDQLVASTPSAAANPQIPAVTVNGPDRTVLAFYVASDNLTAPTAATGYTPQTAATTNTGTDAGFQIYLDNTSTSVVATTPTGGATSAQNFQVYFVASFRPTPSAVAEGLGYGSFAGYWATKGAYISTSGFPVDTEQLGMSFIGNGQKLDKARFTLRRTVGANGTVAAVLYAHTGTYGSDGTGTGSILATSNAVNLSTITTDTNDRTLNTTFTFPDSEKYLLTNGTPYVMVVSYTNAGTNGLSMPQFQTSGIPKAYLGNSSYRQSNGVWLSYANWFQFSVETTSTTTTVISTVNRTATGSGVGTETATGGILIAIQRTATGSGIGTESATGLVIPIINRTATGSGAGTESAIGSITFIRDASGSGVATQIADGLLTLFRTATGSGVGSATGSILVSVLRTATGVGSSDQFASGLIPVTYNRTASGAGSGTQTAVATKGKLRVARGIGHSAISAQPSSFNLSLSTIGETTFWVGQTFAGTGSVLDSIRLSMNENGSAANTVVNVSIYALSGTLASGTPTGSVLATSANVTIPIVSVGPPTFFPFTGANRIVLSNGVNYAFVIRYISGTNGYQIRQNYDTDLTAGAYVYSSNSGGSWISLGATVELIYGVYGADATGSRLVSRTATGSGTGTQSATAVITELRTAIGSGTGTEIGIGFKTVLKDATGSGIGSSVVNSETVHIKTANDSGVGTSVADVFHIKVRSAEGFGVGNATVSSLLTANREATGSGVGTGEGDDQLVHSRDAVGSGVGTSTANTLVESFRNATGSGIGSATSVSFKTKFRTGRVRAKADAVEYWDDSGLAGANWYYQSLNTSSGISKYGQSFLATKTATLDSVEFLVHKVGVPPGNIRAQLYAANSYDSIVAFLASSDSVVATSLLGPFPATSSAAFHNESWKPTKFNFSGNQRVQITAGNYYIIVLEYEGYATSDINNAVRVTYQFVPEAVQPQHPGYRHRYLPGSNQWTYQTAHDVVFWVTGAQTTTDIITPGLTSRTATGSGTSNSVIFSRIPLSGLKWSYWGTNALIETP